jgi:signal recognition particle GTPase
VPVLFVGTGEKMDDIADFDPDDFVDALVGDGRV